MSRRLAWLTAVALMAAILVLGGIVSVRVDFHPPRWAPAAQLWTNAPPDGSPPDYLGLWVRLAKGARPAVVNVSTVQSRAGDPRAEFFRRFFEGAPGGPRASLGSGFLVSPDGYVVTNNHVVAEGGDIVVRLDRGTEHPARVVGTDPATDLALLKIEGAGFPVLPLGDSDRLEVGEPVMAIGNPFGLDQTVTTGIVSAKERFIGSGPYDDFIQTDASVNPGNSGGPLIDHRGAVIGINTAIFSQSGGSVGIGFAIPINLAKTVITHLRDRGSVVRGWLGVAVRPVTAQVAESAGLPDTRGALVDSVVQSSPAARAGVRKGDVIVAVDDQPIGGPQELTRKIAGSPPGTSVRVGVLRDGARQTIAVELGRLPDRRS